MFGCFVISSLVQGCGGGGVGVGGGCFLKTKRDQPSSHLRAVLTTREITCLSESTKIITWTLFIG